MRFKPGEQSTQVVLQYDAVLRDLGLLDRAEPRYTASLFSDWEGPYVVAAEPAFVQVILRGNLLRVDLATRKYEVQYISHRLRPAEFLQRGARSFITRADDRGLVRIDRDGNRKWLRVDGSTGFLTADQNALIRASWTKGPQNYVTYIEFDDPTLFRGRIRTQIPWTKTRVQLRPNKERTAFLAVAKHRFAFWDVVK